MSQAEKWEEGENGEERTAAHGKHMSCMEKKKIKKDAYTEEKGEVGEIGLEREGGWEGCEVGAG